MNIKHKVNKGPEKEINFVIQNILSPTDNNVGDTSPTNILELGFKLSLQRIYFIGAVQEMTSKNLMDWKVNGLLPELATSEEQKWSRFNFLEVLWLLTIKELKRFGVSNAVIKKVKDDLIFSEEKYNNAKRGMYSIKNFKSDTAFKKYSNDDLALLSESYSYDYAIGDFNSVVTEILVSKINSRLIVLPNGESYFWRGRMDFLEKRLFEEDYSTIENPTKTIESIENESYVSISLTNLIMNNLLMSETNFDVVSKLIFTNAEMDLIKHLRKDNVTEIKVVLNNKKVERIEVTEKPKLNAEARIQEIILKNGYQDLQFTTKDGMIMSFKRTTKYQN